MQLDAICKTNLDSQLIGDVLFMNWVGLVLVKI